MQALRFNSIKSRVTLSMVGLLVVSIALTTMVLVRAAERDTLSTHRDRELREGARTANILSHRIVDLQKVNRPGF